MGILKPRSAESLNFMDIIYEKKLKVRNHKNQSVLFF